MPDALKQPARPPAAAATPTRTIESLHVVKDVTIDAAQDVVWESVLEQMGPAAEGADGLPMDMKLEPWPGGRWYRDTGAGMSGHLWGHVQVIKPPKLLEIVGPMFMSYAIASHVQYRLTPDGERTRLTITHTAIGLIDPEHGRSVHTGWQKVVDRVVRLADARRRAR